MYQRHGILRWKGKAWNQHLWEWLISHSLFAPPKLISFLCPTLHPGSFPHNWLCHLHFSVSWLFVGFANEKHWQAIGGDKRKSFLPHSLQNWYSCQRASCPWLQNSPQFSNTASFFCLFRFKEVTVFHFCSSLGEDIKNTPYCFP